MSVETILKAATSRIGRDRNSPAEIRSASGKMPGELLNRADERPNLGHELSRSTASERPRTIESRQMRSVEQMRPDGALSRRHSVALKNHVVGQKKTDGENLRAGSVRSASLGHSRIVKTLFESDESRSQTGGLLNFGLARLRSDSMLKEHAAMQKFGGARKHRGDLSRSDAIANDEQMMIGFGTEMEGRFGWIAQLPSAT